MLLVKDEEMRKIKVLQQVLDPSGAGGVSAEYRALSCSALNAKYEFLSMILLDFRAGLNLHDIMFYYKRIQDSNPDIIHIRGAAIDGLNAIIAAKLARKGKILVTVHGMYSDLIYISPLKRWISKNIIERIIYSLADGISCVCQNASDRPYFDKYRKKMLPFVYNRMPHFDARNAEKYRSEIRLKHAIPQDAIVGLYVGRMTKEKGLEVLANALQELSTQWPKDLWIVFVGEGVYRIELESKMRDISINTVFMGEQREVEKYYDSSDFCIQPSLHENHSIALLEAYAAKKPCVATDCGGNTEIVEEDIGIIVPTNNVQFLADGIKKMYSNEIRTQFICNIEKHDFSKFSDYKVDKALDNVYKSLLYK